MNRNPTIESSDSKVALIREFMSDLVGKSLTKYETAEILHEDGTWSPWPDLPIRLYADSAVPVSVVWSGFDKLWIERGDTLPFSIEGSTVRWVENAIPKVNDILGKEILSVLLGKDSMLFGSYVEIWVRLTLKLENGWFEIFNNLDENGYEFHTRKPDCESITCVRETCRSRFARLMKRWLGS